MRYRLLCLDAGFTLLSPKRTLAQSLAGVLEQNGHKVDEADLQAAWQAADRWFWDEYARPDNVTWGDDALIEETWRDYHSVMLRELGLDEQRKLLDLVLESQFAADAWEPYPDVIPMLETLRSSSGGGRGALQIGIVSDWGSNLEGIVQRLGLDAYLDFVLASGAVGVAKPNPAFFSLAISRAEVSPDEALMVGDSLRADVEGARSAGMDAILIDRDGETKAEGVPIIRSLTELPAIMAGTATPMGAGTEGTTARSTSR
jgi:putative hydrolase of the HAD superfamily